MADGQADDPPDDEPERAAGTHGGGGRNGDGTPHVELSMYQLSVAVRGSPDDALVDVSDAACDLMDYLAEKSRELEERPDDRGLG
jgi:hypothetical protein